MATKKEERYKKYIKQEMANAKAVSAQTEILLTVAVRMSLFVATAMITVTLPMSLMEVQSQMALFIMAETQTPLLCFR